MRLGEGIRREDFGKDFHWGVAVSAYQIEGGWQADGKGPSIWDAFVRRAGKIDRRETGDVACDFYHRYLEDIQLMRELSIPAFRFSISWPRILPEGKGKPNPEGIRFYHQVIDACLAANIEPWVTLYHWDLPLALEEAYGGWADRKIIEDFLNYAELCAKEYGGKVKYWMILNEPLAFTILGYLLGVHAPGHRSVQKFLAAVHHAALVQAEGIRLLKSLLPKAVIGTTFSVSPTFPHRPNNPKDIAAARRFDALFNRIFIEPLLGKGYPVNELPLLRDIYNKYLRPGDEERLRANPDFIGIQNYTREAIKHHALIPYIKARTIPAKRRGVPYHAMGWEVYPESMYLILKQFSQYDPNLTFIITESGYAGEGETTQDTPRLEYLKAVLRQIHRAKQEGIRVEGYFIWTLMDNFEWAEGYRPQFGIVYVDRATLRRQPKASAHWYKKFLENKEAI
ncbi:MAG: GH1 family beta-glucosidase [Bacteroidia bacterium]|nr:GH1 family beta-glucosidase [Bacteroidia bacterium]MDW8235525.1 GH1 family beta-glucosidase [Bacteroidia bacterium]